MSNPEPTPAPESQPLSDTVTPEQKALLRAKLIKLGKRAGVVAALVATAVVSASLARSEVFADKETTESTPTEQ